MSTKVFVHEKGDVVGVAVEEIKRGEKVEGWTMSDESVFSIQSKSDISVGHKIALKEIKKGEDIIKYNHPIGVATQDIAKGEYVHTHNVKSRRWQK